jgi:hypothetical protein
MKIIINLGREILLLGSVRESIMTPSETSSEKNILHIFFLVSIAARKISKRLFWTFRANFQCFMKRLTRKKN